MPRPVVVALVAFCVLQAVFFALTLVVPRPQDVTGNPAAGIAFFRSSAWEAIRLPWLAFAVAPGFLYAAWRVADRGSRALYAAALAFSLGVVALMATEPMRVFDASMTDDPARVWVRLEIGRWATFLLSLAALVALRLARRLEISA